jgi:hypothetical protein
MNTVRTGVGGGIRLLHLSVPSVNLRTVDLSTRRVEVKILLLKGPNEFFLFGPQQLPLRMRCIR